MANEYVVKDYFNGSVRQWVIGVIALCSSIAYLLAIASPSSASCAPTNQFYFQGQLSTYSHQFTGAELFIKLNVAPYNLDTYDNHVNEHLGVYGHPLGWYTCDQNQTQSNPNGSCWVQDGLSTGFSGALDNHGQYHSISTNAPTVY